MTTNLQLEIDERMDRRNGVIYMAIFLLSYLSSPVFSIGVVQAGLCDKLGARATVSNLPAAALLLGGLAPFFLSWLIPHRADRKTVVWANALTAISAGAVCFVLFLPFSSSVRLAVVIGQSLIVGFTTGTGFVYLWQCLGRGTSLAGRAKIFGYTYTLGPLFAVAGSLSAQYVVGGGISSLRFPYDFAVLYLMGVPIMGLAAYLASHFILCPMEDEQHPPFQQYLIEGVKSFIDVRQLGVASLGYLFWYIALSFMQNLTLFSRVAMHRAPAALVGLMLALRYAGKSVNGYCQGRINLRWGLRAPLIVTTVMLIAAVAWGWIVPGTFYLFSFALMGAGELGGAYFPNYILASSKASDGARNISVLQLTSLPLGFAPVIYGQLADRLGFGSSFLFAGFAGLVALWLVLTLPVISVAAENGIKTVSEEQTA